MLGRSPDVPPASELGDHSYMAYLRVDDVDGFYDQAAAAGADILKPPTDEPWGMRELALRSPDGHRFMLARPIDPPDHTAGSHAARSCLGSGAHVSAAALDDRIQFLPLRSS
jgi:hypothetical protein